MNATLGHTGVLLGLVASVVGAAVIATGLARRRPATIRSGQIYAALILLGAVVATVAMQRALITHDFSIAFTVLFAYGVQLWWRRRRLERLAAQVDPDAMS